jgi:NAD(P)-dependent dehydrogenase (short-subunit alcohol dehydrogenase family)
VNVNLGGSVAIVTGGGRGLGAGVSTRFRAEGAEVVVFDLRREVEIEGTTFLETDVTDEEQVDKAVADVVERFGHIDTLVNCAGVMGPLGPIDTITVDSWRRTLDINLNGTFIATRAVLPTMLAAGKGSIVNFASGSGVDHQSGQAPYNASKAAVISLTKTVARDVHIAGVRINAVCPGNCNTPLIQGFLEQDISDELPKIQENQRLHREMTEAGLIWEPEEVMDLVVFLASDAGSHLNGQFVRMTTKYDPGVYH